MSTKRLKQSIVSLPVIGYVIRLISDSARLPKIYDKLHTNLTEIDGKYTELKIILKEISKASETTNKQLIETTKSLSSVQLAQDNLQGLFDLLEKSLVTKSKFNTVKQSSMTDLFANDHIMDSFYTDFEDNFRGSEKTILERLEVYLPYFKNSKINFSKNQVLDIGSGRGEFLQLLKANKIEAIGLDINLDMVERSKSKSLQAIQGDGLTHLLDVKSQTYGAITGFHIVEHIPFNVLMRIFKSAHRALISGGFVIFETPNPENIIVASSGFYTDPSHLNPIPPDLLAFALKTSGFIDVEIKRLHPVDVTPKEIAGVPEEISGRFYGPRDYAVIAYK